jgi:hypothetical protein
VVPPYTLIIGCHVTIVGSLPNGKACQRYKGMLTPSCPGRFTVAISGVLPPGLTPLPSTGELSGTPTMAGKYPLTVRIRTESGCVAGGDYTITIDPPDSLPTVHLFGTVCVPVKIPIAGTIVGTLPPDLVPNEEDHVLQGTPRVPGTNVFVAIDPKRCPPEQPYDITIVCPTKILPDDLPHVLPFYHWVDIVISRPALKDCLTYSVDESTLPHGLHLVGDHLMGKPDQLEKTKIAVTATDARHQCTVTEIYCLEIVDPPLCEALITLAPPPMKLVPPGTVGVPYPPRKFIASGGVAPYAYDAGTPALPPGLSLSLKGVLSGTPTAPGRFNFSVWAVDTTGTIGCPQVYTIEIGN